MTHIGNHAIYTRVRKTAVVFGMKCGIWGGGYVLTLNRCKNISQHYCDAILVTNSFSANVLACLPAMPWALTEEDIRRRKDLRGLNICSIDPPGCTDIDDALHLRDLPNGNFEVWGKK